MAIDIRTTGDFCVRAAKPENGEGEGTRHEIIGTNSGYTVPKGSSPETEKKIEANFLKRVLGA